MKMKLFFRRSPQSTEKWSIFLIQVNIYTSRRRSQMINFLLQFLSSTVRVVWGLTELRWALGSCFGISEMKMVSTGFSIRNALSLLFCNCVTDNFTSLSSHQLQETSTNAASQSLWSSFSFIIRPSFSQASPSLLSHRATLHKYLVPNFPPASQLLSSTRFYLLLLSFWLCFFTFFSLVVPLKFFISLSQKKSISVSERECSE